jgi:hypothetical protein
VITCHTVPVADLDRLAVQISDGLRKTLARVGTLAIGVTIVATVVGVATFATGLWLFRGSRPSWTVFGGLLCAIPIVASALGWLYVRGTARVAPALVSDVRTLLRDSRNSAKVLINHDTGQRLASTAKTFGALRTELKTRRRDMPALFAGVRAITSVPGLAAIAVVGTLLVGVLGAILLVVGLVK